MNSAELIERLDVREHNGGYRVTARESGNLEFKLMLDLRSFRKSLKTIVAFSNQADGTIVFGIRDRPRDLVGIGDAILDEGHQSEQLVSNIVPCPQTDYFTFELHGMNFAALHVYPLAKPPAIAIRDLVGEGGTGQILKQGMIYHRRRGQTSAISGEEFSQLLAGRDEQIRQEIFGFLARGRDIGFDQAVVADTRGVENEEGDATFYLPADAATKLNFIDRARLVETDGAPAYEILGNIRLTVPNANDPRNPMRAVESAENIKPILEETFWADFPWAFGHLKKAAEHLGFWANSNGDGTNTGRETLTGTTIYYQNGRRAVCNWARQNPDDFIQTVGSAATRAEWARRQQG